MPYVLMLVCCGMPIFFLELALGQFSSVGPVSVWAMSPIFKGTVAVRVLYVELSEHSSTTSHAYLPRARLFDADL